MENAVIQQGMIPKVKACIDALDEGVKKTHIIDARTPHGLLLEIFTNPAEETSGLRPALPRTAQERRRRPGGHRTNRLSGPG